MMLTHDTTTTQVKPSTHLQFKMYERIKKIPDERCACNKSIDLLGP